MDIAGSMVFHCTSPYLCTDKPASIRECPVGMILRESPELYRVIAAHNDVRMDSSILREPLWLQSAFAVIASEKSRHRVRAEADNKTKRDAQYGAAVRGR